MLIQAYAPQPGPSFASRHQVPPLENASPTRSASSISLCNRYLHDASASTHTTPSSMDEDENLSETKTRNSTATLVMPPLDAPSESALEASVSPADTEERPHCASVLDPWANQGPGKDGMVPALNGFPEIAAYRVETPTPQGSEAWFVPRKGLKPPVLDRTPSPHSPPPLQLSPLNEPETLPGDSPSTDVVMPVSNPIATPVVPVVTMAAPRAHAARPAPALSRTESSARAEIERMRASFSLRRTAKRASRRLIGDDDKVLVGHKVSEGHANYVMAYNMLTGIRVAVSLCLKAMVPLVDKDFRYTHKLAFDITGTELTPSSKYDFKFKDYAPNVFRELRTLFGLDPADYLVSLTEKYILSELGSPGKSGSFFYYSRDYRFIIKTIHHSEQRQLLRILPEYYRHVKANPNTLVSQFYGLHRVKMPFGKNGMRKVHFIVMNNLFPPHRDIHRTFDLKGSLMGRYTRINPQEPQAAPILKDLNWLESRDNAINFGPAKRKLFLDQLHTDVALLKRLNIMDYSLLLGVHEVALGNTDELTNQRLSVFQPKATDKKSVINTNPESINRMNDLPTAEFPGRSELQFYCDDGGIRATNEDDEPLGEIYYLGIIDCLTRYGFVKRMETFWRTLSNDRMVVSAIPAGEYGDRFYNFMKNGLGINKKKKD